MCCRSLETRRRAAGLDSRTSVAPEIIESYFKTRTELGKMSAEGM